MAETNYEWIEDNIPVKLVAVVHDTARRAANAIDSTDRLVYSSMIAAMVETIIATGIMDGQTTSDYVTEVYRRECEEAKK